MMEASDAKKNARIKNRRFQSSRFSHHMKTPASAGRIQKSNPGPAPERTAPRNTSAALTTGTAETYLVAYETVQKKNCGKAPATQSTKHVSTYGRTNPPAKSPHSIATRRGSVR